jgi:hypothetical protein
MAPLLHTPAPSDPRCARLSSITLTSPLSTGFPSLLYKPTMALRAALLPLTAAESSGKAPANPRPRRGLDFPPKHVLARPLSHPWQLRFAEGLVHRTEPAVSDQRVLESGRWLQERSSSRLRLPRRFFLRLVKFLSKNWVWAGSTSPLAGARFGTGAATIPIWQPIATIPTSTKDVGRDG